MSKEQNEEVAVNAIGEAPSKIEGMDIGTPAKKRKNRIKSLILSRIKSIPK